MQNGHLLLFLLYITQESKGEKRKKETRYSSLHEVNDNRSIQVKLQRDSIISLEIAYADDLSLEGTNEARSSQDHLQQWNHTHFKTQWIGQCKPEYAAMEKERPQPISTSLPK